MSETNTSILRRGLTRRQSLLGILPAAAAIAMIGRVRAGQQDDLTAALEALEKQEGGRLGVHVLDTGNGSERGNRSNELFALCSTFKLVLAAAILQRHDAGSVSLDRVLDVTKADIIPNSPVTEKMAGKTMTVGELCHATMTTSDNAAANILLRELGGPEPITAFLRGIGDTVTRLDRAEPHMNNADVAAGDTRDTTSPAAMAATMKAIVLGDVLTPASREIITGWLKAAVTGKTRLKAGFPKDWITGDKTGTGKDGPTNDVAITWPPGRAPLIVSVYYERKGSTMAKDAAVIAEVGRIVGRSA
ncbi:MAG: class A beta-lactamase [Micropepsaceae bacterium]